MESDINVTTISGLVVTDVEFRVIPKTKNCVSIFRIVSNNISPNADGAIERKSTYLTVKTYGKLAERAHACLQRSTKLTVAGKLVEESWLCPDEKRRKSHLILEAFSFQVHSVAPTQNKISEKGAAKQRPRNVVDNRADDANISRTGPVNGHRVKPIPPPASYN